MKVLLDTTTVIAAIKGRLPVVLQLARLKPGEVAVSVVSRLEAEAALRRSGSANSRSAKLLREFFGAVRVLDFGEREAAEAVSLTPYLPAGRSPLAAFELLMAATALAHRLTLVTASPERYAELPGLQVQEWR